MRISVRVKTGQKKNEVTPPLLKHAPNEDVSYIIAVKERPIDGKANKEIEKLLASYFKTSRTRVRLISGVTSKRKIFEVTR